MKPNKSGFGVLIENRSEVATLRAAADVSKRFLEAGAEQMPEERDAMLGYAALFESLGTQIQDILDVHELGDPDEQCSMTFEDEYSATELVPFMLSIAAKHHEDELVKMSAAEMTRSYEAAIFATGMGEQPS
jgi:hypothetical protein